MRIFYHIFFIKFLNDLAVEVFGVREEKTLVVPALVITPSKLNFRLWRGTEGGFLWILRVINPFSELFNLFKLSLLQRFYSFSLLSSSDILAFTFLWSFRESKISFSYYKSKQFCIFSMIFLYPWLQLLFPSLWIFLFPWSLSCKHLIFSFYAFSYPFLTIFLSFSLSISSFSSNCFYLTCTYFSLLSITIILLFNSYY